MVGQLQYHARWDAVTFRHDEAVQTFPAARLAQFRFFDVEMKVWRKFYPYIKPDEAFPRPEFYEVVFAGDFQLMRRRKPIEPVRRGGEAASARDQLLWEQVAAYDYFFKHGNDIVPLTGFRQYMTGSDFAADLERYAEAHRLSWRTAHDIVLMLNYLNCLLGTGCRQELLLDKMMASG